MANSITGNQGTAHAVAYNGNHHCHVTGWIASATAPTTTQTVTVQCYDPAGNRFNGQFYVLYQRESSTSTEWNDAYLWADRNTLPNYTPDVLFNWNSKGTANTMTRSSAGRYRAILTGLNSKVKHFGDVMVDTYASSNGTQSTGWVHMANISHCLGRTLKFEVTKRHFAGDAEANKMMTRDYRKPYVVPDKV